MSKRSMNNRNKFTTLWCLNEDLGGPFVVVQDTEGNWEVIDGEDLGL